jgi:hypothetical protein
MPKVSFRMASASREVRYSAYRPTRRGEFIGQTTRGPVGHRAKRMLRTEGNVIGTTATAGFPLAFERDASPSPCRKTRLLTSPAEVCVPGRWDLAVFLGVWATRPQSELTLVESNVVRSEVGRSVVEQHRKA